MTFVLGGDPFCPQPHGRRRIPHALLTVPVASDLPCSMSRRGYTEPSDGWQPPKTEVPIGRGSLKFFIITGWFTVMNCHLHPARSRCHHANDLLAYRRAHSQL